MRDAIGHVRSADPRLLGALAWWTFDASVLWAMLHAFGAPPPFAVVVLAYFVGQVGNTIPIPGAVSGGIVGVLVAFAVPADLALVSVLAYRAIAIWLPAPIGLVALGALRRTMARWSAEDAAAEVQAHDAAPTGPRTCRYRSPARRARARSPRCSPHEAAPRHVAGAAGAARAVPRRLLASACSAPPPSRLVTAGVVRLPDLEGLLTDLSDTLGAWTYALVAALAFLETGAFVGLVAPGETAIVLGGVVAAEGGVDLGHHRRRLGGRGARRPRELRARPAPGPALPGHPRPARRHHRARAWRASRRSSTVTAPRRSSSGASSGSSARSPRSWPGPRACACASFLPWSLLGTRAVGDRLHARRLRLPQVPSPPPRTR